jgi:hypothetical protein
VQVRRGSALGFDVFVDAADLVDGVAVGDSTTRRVMLSRSFSRIEGRESVRPAAAA